MRNQKITLISFSLSLNLVVQFSFFATKHTRKTSFMLDNGYYMARNRIRYDTYYYLTELNYLA